MLVERGKECVIALEIVADTQQLWIVLSPKPKGSCVSDWCTDLICEPANVPLIEDWRVVAKIAEFDSWIYQVLEQSFSLLSTRQLDRVGTGKFVL